MECLLCTTSITDSIGHAEICETCFFNSTGCYVEELPKAVQDSIGYLTLAAYSYWVSSTLSTITSMMSKPSTRAPFSAETSLYPLPGLNTGASSRNREPLSEHASVARPRPAANPLGAACSLALPTSKVTSMKIRLPGRTGILMGTITEAWADSIGETIPTETVEAFRSFKKQKKLGRLSRTKPILTEEAVGNITSMANGWTMSSIMGNATGQIEFYMDGGETLIHFKEKEAYPHYAYYAFSSYASYVGDPFAESCAKLALLLSLPKVRDRAGILEVTYEE